MNKKLVFIIILCLILNPLIPKIPGLGISGEMLFNKTLLLNLNMLSTLPLKLVHNLFSENNPHEPRLAKTDTPASAPCDKEAGKPFSGHIYAAASVMIERSLTCKPLIQNIFNTAHYFFIPETGTADTTGKTFLTEHLRPFALLLVLVMLFSTLPRGWIEISLSKNKIYFLKNQLKNKLVFLLQANTYKQVPFFKSNF